MLLNNCTNRTILLAVLANAAQTRQDKSPLSIGIEIPVDRFDFNFIHIIADKLRELDIHTTIKSTEHLIAFDYVTQTTLIVRINGYITTKTIHSVNLVVMIVQ